MQAERGKFIIGIFVLPIPQCEEVAAEPGVIPVNNRWERINDINREPRAKHILKRQREVNMAPTGARGDDQDVCHSMRLLLVVFHDVRIAHLRLVWIEAKFTAGATLAQEVPALIQLKL